MIEARRLEGARGERTLFRDLSFTVSPGELLRITGPNGAGKTTLMRILCGLSLQAGGEVLWNGEPIQRNRAAFHAELVYIGHASGLKADLTAAENLRIICALHGNDPGEDAILAALDTMGLAAQAELPAKVLSQGQRRRVSLARLIAEPACRLWILDEPFAALDVNATEQLRLIVEKHHSDGGMAIFTTHQEVPLPSRSLKTVDLTGARP